MNPDEKSAFIRQQSEAERLMDLREKAILIGAIDAITLAKYPHTGPSKPVDMEGVKKVRGIIRGLYDPPFPNAPCYLDEIQRGL